MKKWAEIILLLVIVGNTLYFGGVQLLGYSLAEIILLLVALLVLAGMAIKGRITVPAPWPLCLFLLLVVFQLIPLPPAVVRLLSPQRLRGPGRAMAASGSHWLALSVYSLRTEHALMLFFAYVCAFALAAYAFDSTQRKSTLIRGLILLGVFEAAYGIIQYLTGWQRIFGYVKQVDIFSATGTYINHDDFAGFLEMIFPFLLAGAFYFAQQWMEQSRWKSEKDGGKPASPGVKALMYLFGVLMLAIAVIFSRSRSGITASLLALVFMVGLAFMRWQGARTIWLVGLAGFLFCVIAYGMFIGLGPVLARFRRVEEPGYLTAEGRTLMWQNTLHMIRDYPITGVGLGDFDAVYRRYQTTMVNFFVAHAHNDYLEYAAETGLAGAALLFLPIFWLFGKMIASFLSDTRRFRSSIVLGCLGSALAILIHSATDFNLHIPANALIFAAVLGVGYKAACYEPKHADPLRETPKRIIHAEPANARLH